MAMLMPVLGTEAGDQPVLGAPPAWLGVSAIPSPLACLRVRILGLEQLGVPSASPLLVNHISLVHTSAQPWGTDSGYKTSPFGCCYKFSISFRSELEGLCLPLSMGGFWKEQVINKSPGKADVGGR